MLKIDAKRHLAKTVSWRAIGTIDTILLSWIISGDPMIGLSIGGLEVISKMILYYFHERVWYKYGFGIQRPRKIKGDINWDPRTSTETATQLAFIQSETEAFIKRIKITEFTDARNGYTVHLSFYDKKTHERFTEIKFFTSKQAIESTYNIKIKRSEHVK